jgi:hypothetical protein
MEFFETGYGKRFFDGQLPQLIKAIERAAAALEKQAPDDGAYGCPECGLFGGHHAKGCQKYVAPPIEVEEGERELLAAALDHYAEYLGDVRQERGDKAEAARARALRARIEQGGQR